MSKNIAILEGTTSKVFNNVEKITTKIAGSTGTQEWVPEDEAINYVDMEELSIDANGVYTAAQENCDGFSKVTVNVQPYMGEDTITENGTYKASDVGLDGFTKVTVNVQPQLGEDTITENGTYKAADVGLDGFTKVTVDVQPDLGTEYITENGTYNASDEGLDGFSSVEVDVQPNLGTKQITQNGTYNAADDSVEGYSSVTVDVPSQASLGSKSVSANGTYNASSDNLDGYSSVTVNVPSQASLGSKSVSANGTYNASSDDLDGYSSVTVNVKGTAIGNSVPAIADTNLADGQAVRIYTATADSPIKTPFEPQNGQGYVYGGYYWYRKSGKLRRVPESDMASFSSDAEEVCSLGISDGSKSLWIANTFVRKGISSYPVISTFDRYYDGDPYRIQDDPIHGYNGDYVVCQNRDGLYYSYRVSDHLVTHICGYGFPYDVDRGTILDAHISIRGQNNSFAETSQIFISRMSMNYPPTTNIFDVNFRIERLKALHDKAFFVNWNGTDSETGNRIYALNMIDKAGNIDLLLTFMGYKQLSEPSIGGEYLILATSSKTYKINADASIEEFNLVLPYYSSADEICCSEKGFFYKDTYYPFTAVENLHMAATNSKSAEGQLGICKGSYTANSLGRAVVLFS